MNLTQGAYYVGALGALILALEGLWAVANQKRLLGAGKAQEYLQRILGGKNLEETEQIRQATWRRRRAFVGVALILLAATMYWLDGC